MDSFAVEKFRLTTLNLSELEHYDQLVRYDASQCLYENPYRVSLLPR
jgi:hypothetical protein